MQGYFYHPLVMLVYWYCLPDQGHDQYDVLYSCVDGIQFKGVLSRFEHLLPQLVDKSARKGQRKGKQKAA